MGRLVPTFSFVHSSPGVFDLSGFAPICTAPAPQFLGIDERPTGGGTAHSFHILSELNFVSFLPFHNE